MLIRLKTLGIRIDQTVEEFMKADVCALSELSKQHSPSIKSIKSGKTQYENEMHNKRASFVAAVFFTKSKSSMLEVACLEMCRCRD